MILAVEFYKHLSQCFILMLRFYMLQHGHQDLGLFDSFIRQFCLALDCGVLDHKHFVFYSDWCSTMESHSWKIEKTQSLVMAGYATLFESNHK